MPAGITFAGNSGDCTTVFPCAFPSIAVGVTQTVVTSVCVPRAYSGANPIPLTAAASATEADLVTSNNDAGANMPVLVDSLFFDGFETCP